MSKSPEPKQPQAQVPWMPPRVRIGDSVFWSKSEGSEQCLGIVTKVGETAISLALLIDGARQVRPVDSVRHHQDPTLRSRPAVDGVWRYTPQTKELYDLFESLSTSG